MTHSSRLSAFCDRVIEAGWLVAVVLAPLFFNVYSSRVFEPDKITLVRSLALVMLGAWLIKWLEERRAAGERPDRVTWRTPLMLPTLLFVIIYVLASLLSVVPRVSIFGSYQRLQGLYSMLSYMVVCWMIVLNLRRRDQLDRLVIVIVMTSLPIAFYGLAQHSGKDPLPWGGDVTTRVAANMGNSNFVASYLIMAFFLTIGRLVESVRAILAMRELHLSNILHAGVYLFVAASQLIIFGFADSLSPLLGWLPGMFIFGLVGLLLLRVSLHSTAAKAAVREQINSDQPVEEQYPIKPLDVIKALGLALVSAITAYICYELVSRLFPEPPITLRVVFTSLGGFIPLLVAVGIRRTSARWLWASWILFAAIGVMGLFLIIFSDHPAIVEARQDQTFGRLSSLLESDTGRVQALIWKGATQLITSHEPLQFPDGSSDNLNSLRPLIGYGPESMYVAYNRFYPPDLAHYEARNASPDRAHNETWDSFVNTGVAGFVLEQLLFLGLFFYALKFIGWIPNRRVAFALVGAMVLFGLLGAIGLGAALGVNFMGAGWPGGVTVGLALYVIAFALFHFKISRDVYMIIAALLIGIIDLATFGATFTSANRAVGLALATSGGVILFALMYLLGRYVFNPTAGQPTEVGGHIFILVALFSAILAHYLEISLAGTAIASTRLYFWTYAGLLVVVGLHWVPWEETETEVMPLKEAETQSVPSEGTEAPLLSPEETGLRSVLSETIEIQSVSPKGTESQSVPVSTSAATDKGHLSSNRLKWVGAVVALALVGSLILATLGYAFLNVVPSSEPQDVADVIEKSLTTRPYANNEDSSSALLMLLVTWLLGGLLVLTELSRRKVISARTIWLAAPLYYGVSIVIAGLYWLLQAWQILEFNRIMANQTEIRTVEQLAQHSATVMSFADAISSLLTVFYLFVALVIFSMAILLMFEVRGRLPWLTRKWSPVVVVPIGLAVLLGVTSTNLNPVRADIIYKQADAIRNSGQLDLAIAHFKRACELNPTEDFYYLWMGAAFLDKANTPLQTRSVLSSTPTLEEVLNLKFETMYQLNQDDALIAAHVVLLHARVLNPLNTDHSANLARLHRRWADLKATDPATRQQELETAAEYYRQATALSPNNVQLLDEWGLVEIAMSDLARQASDADKADTYLADAKARVTRALELDAQYDQTYVLLAQIVHALGNPEEARQYYEQALKWNPRNMDAWYAATTQLIEAEDYVGAERLTLAFLKKNLHSLPALRLLARNIYYPQDRLEEAIDIMQQVLWLAPYEDNHWDDLYVTAVFLAQDERLQEALLLAQQSLEVAPRDKKANIQSLIGQLQKQLDDSP